MVIADRVNLRNAGSLESDVIGQVNYGDLMTGLELTDDWVRVRAPATLGVWVHGGLLFEDREVRTRVLNMRSGPGTQFDVLGQLERMDPVKVLERYDEWRRIQPTDAVQVWIFRELVMIPEGADEPEAGEESGLAGLDSPEEEALPESTVEAGTETLSETGTETGTEEVIEAVTETAEPDTDLDVTADTEEAEAELPLVEVEPVPEVVAVVEAEPAPAAEEVSVPEDVRLVPLEGQGTASVRRGWVKAYLIAGSAPSRFHLVFRERGREESLAYLRGDEEQIRSLVGQHVLVRGRDFWVAGQRVPLTHIESIEAVAERGQ